VDLDRYIAANDHQWRRLEELTKRIGALLGRGRVDESELDEFLRLYQRCSAQLSHVRSHYQDTALTQRLTMLVGRARTVIYAGRRRSPWAVIGDFFARDFPGAVWHARWAMAASALAFFGPAIGVALWLLNDPAAMDASASAASRQFYVEELFEQYYSEQSPIDFFLYVTFNNIWVGFLAFAGGATAGIFTVIVLVSNGWYGGEVAAWMYEAEDGARFWGFILPHGLLELSAIVIAGGAAFVVAGAMLVPGERTRTDALRDAGQRAGTIALGVVTLFVLAGLIEGFVTGRGFSPEVRIGIGAIGWLAAMAYFGIVGRRAAAEGFTGLIGEQPRRWEDEPSASELLAQLQGESSPDATMAPPRKG